MEYATGGAIATTAPNPCGTPTGHHYLYGEMLKKIYVENERVLGRIVYDAKCRIISTYFPVDSLYGPAVLNNLIGDPALRLRYAGIVDINEGRGAIPVSRDIRVLPGICQELKVPGSADVIIWNASGRCVFKEHNVSAGRIIDLPAGVYFVNLNFQRDHEVPDQRYGSLEKIIITGCQ